MKRESEIANRKPSGFTLVSIDNGVTDFDRLPETAVTHEEQMAFLTYIVTEIPTNVGFGRGTERKTLNITAGKSLYRNRLNKAGYELPGSRP